MKSYLAILVLGILCAETWSFSARSPRGQKHIGRRPVQPQPRIYGGSKAEEGQFPHQASVRRDGGHDCGASILNSKAVLTAAHCCQNFYGISGVEVEVGTIQSGQGQIHPMESFLIHPSYNCRTFEADICLVFINGSFEFNDATVQTIDLGTEEDCQVGIQCLMSGWGEVEYYSGSSEDLMYAEAPILDNGNCLIRSGFLEDSMTCAGVLDDSTGLGYGDSGGPLACNNKLCGVASWEDFPWELPGFPSAFAKVPAYKEWIEENINFLNPINQI